MASPPVKFPVHKRDDERDRNRRDDGRDDNQYQDRTQSLVNYGIAILNFVAERNGLSIDEEARDVFAQALRENSEEPTIHIFEMRKSGATRRFGNGVEQVSELAAFLALKQKRVAIRASDIIEAIRRRFCSCWPFCRKKP